MITSNGAKRKRRLHTAKKKKNIVAVYFLGISVEEKIEGHRKLKVIVDFKNQFMKLENEHISKEHVIMEVSAIQEI